MKKARALAVAGSKKGTGGTVADPQAAAPTPNSEVQTKDAWKYTSKIEFLDVGEDENEDRYLRWRIGDSVALISIANVFRDPTEVYVRLQRKGVILSQEPERREFLKRVRIEGEKEPTFSVANRPGLFKGRFHFPDDLISQKSTTAFYADERHLQIYRKFRCAGSPAGWQSLVKLAKGNSRFILGLALAFAGPVCGALGLDPPGIQFIGEGGAGKTPLARLVSAVWGWDPDGSTRLGFGTSWKMRSGGLEIVAEAYNHTMIFLDEMSKATKEQVEFVMTIAQGQGTARMTELRRRIWSMPVLSTSNCSVVEIMEKLGFEFDSAYVDRLLDVPAPAKVCILENLHGHPDIAAFFAHACKVAEENHGYPGRVFADKFTSAFRKDAAKLRGDIEAAREMYLQAAADIKSDWRHLVRTHGRFATIFASGCLAIKFEALPLLDDELLEAILKCERDHVKFIDDEVHRLGVLPVASASQLNNSAHSVGGARPAPKLSPLTKLKRYLDENIPVGLIDIRDPSSKLPEGHDHKKGPGYIGVHKDKIEIWLTNLQVEKIAGGGEERKALKQKLVDLGLVKVWGRGHGKIGATVRRPIAGLGDQTVVAIKPSKAMLARLPKLKNAK